MGTVLERKTIEKTEQEQHNAQISERYRQLLSTVEDQFATPTEMPKTEFAETVNYEETPIAVQTPDVSTYAPVYAPEQFERLEELANRQRAILIEEKNTRAVQKVSEGYSLSPLAKAAMAALAVIVTVMLIMIGVNSAMIRQRRVRLRELETEKEEIIDENNEIANYIKELQSDANILKRAEELGLLGK